ncbi:MAG: hypothetical protein V1915_03635 [Candidatus Bathyarchaeota archaeon]
MDAAVRIEKGGKPTVLLVATPFREEVISHSKLHGIPYLPFVVLDYRQELIPLIPPAVKKAFEKILKPLTTPAKELEKQIPGEVI